MGAFYKKKILHVVLNSHMYAAFLYACICALHAFTEFIHFVAVSDKKYMPV